jgi:putative ABC transport system permease protein
MSPLRALFLRLRSFFRKDQLDRDLNAELNAHLELHIEEKLAAGMTPEAARREALLKLGGIEQTKESVRDRRGLPSLESLLQDFRFALRLLRKSPLFTLVVVLTLALGIGANTAIFTLLDQTILRSLPVQDPAKLVLLRYSGCNGGFSFTRTHGGFYFSYPMYRDLRDKNTVFRGLIATAWAQVGVQWRNQSDPVEAELVSGNYFDVLGVQPALGRLLLPSDDAVQEANPVVVLSFDYWQRRFGSDTSVLNQTILLNGRPFTILGVTQPGFRSAAAGDGPALFAPMMMKPQLTPGWNDLDQRRSSWLNIIGRLKPEFTRERAQTATEPLWHSLRVAELSQRGHSSKSFEDAFLTNSHLFLDDGARGIPVHGSLPATLLVVMAMAGLTILMVWTNVGTLLLVRAAARTREISVRFTLGATRARIAQQLLLEGVLLGLAGGVAAMFLAPEISALLIRTIWPDIPEKLLLTARPDLRILCFNFSLAFLTSLLFSFAPVFQFWHPDLAPALKQQSAARAGTPLMLRRALVVAQIGLSLLLLIGAGLLLRTLHNLQTVDVGFATDHLVTFSIDPLQSGYEPGQAGTVYQRILGNLAGISGVRSAAATNDPELSDNSHTANITIDGYRPTENEDMNVEWASVTSGYFSTLKLPLLAGRELTELDRGGGHKVAVVNEDFARHFFGEPQIAVGHYLGQGAGNVKIDTEIVGVVKDTKHQSVRDNAKHSVFLPFLQDETTKSRSSGMTFYVRTLQPPETAESAIRLSIVGLDSRMILNKFRTMQEQMEENLMRDRVVAFLASAFGLLSALMAAIGVYGVLAYSTVQRTRELGIRMALGATRASIVRIVLGEVLWLTAVGVAVGLPLSFLFTSAVRTQLFGVSFGDPWILGASIVFVGAAALASAALPAWRAGKVDPVIALRYE